MTVERRTIVYDGPGGLFEGVVAVDTAIAGPRPGVLIVPNVLGQKEADNVVAERLAAMGYVGFAGDVFGQGCRAARDDADPARFMKALNADRALLRDRLFANVAALHALPEVDATRTAAIGYCFGGKAVIDLARAGGEVLGVVAFHGLYDTPALVGVLPIAPKLLICHGWDDPLAPPHSLVALGIELTASRADWRLHAWGGAGHGFTDMSMQGSTRPGFGYHAAADRESWAAMTGFLGDLFG